MTMDLKVEGTVLQALLEKATLEALGVAGQEALLKEVVRYLTTAPPSSNYSSIPASPLLIALRTASDRAAVKFFSEKVEKDPEFVAVLEGLYVEAVRRWQSADTREKLVVKMAERLSTAFGDRY